MLYVLISVQRLPSSKKEAKWYLVGLNKAMAGIIEEEELDFDTLWRCVSWDKKNLAKVECDEYICGKGIRLDSYDVAKNSYLVWSPRVRVGVQLFMEVYNLLKMTSTGNCSFLEKTYADDGCDICIQALFSSGCKFHEIRRMWSLIREGGNFFSYLDETFEEENRVVVNGCITGKWKRINDMFVYWFGNVQWV